MTNLQPLENGHLNASQKDGYWQNGYLFPMQVIPPEEAATLRRELETLEANWLDADLPRPLNTYKRLNANCTISLAARIASDPRVLNVVEGILGPDILLWGAELFIKEPHTSAYVSMHQDLTYWGMGEIDGLVTAWIALSPATVASGCMEFVAGSHKNPILPHQDTHGDNNLLSRGQEIKVEVAPEDRVTVELRPGQMSLHHGLTIHGSGPNTSDDRRIAIAMRFLRPDMAQMGGAKDYAMLVRGEDRFGNFHHYDGAASDFSADSLAMFETIRDAQNAILMKGSDQKASYD